MKKILFLLLLPLQVFTQSFTGAEISKWQQQAKQVTVIRDNWGIPHIYGKTDADAVFGLLYAQCEDDFKRVEMNYIEKLGRLSEVNGEKDLYNDLYIKLIVDSAEAMTDYKKAPLWLQKLMNAYADGINYYLYKNPQVKPLLLHRFQPWYPLLWTDGSIGAISTGGITQEDLKNFYTGNDSPLALRKTDPDFSSGSNGFAVAPSKTASGNSILYINPHVTFYFRPEVHVVSEEASPDDPVDRGLNVYGAVTWGQFFVYQGFNENCGWMHTSSNVDVADLYVEKVIKNDSGLFYKYNYSLRRITEKKITISYTTGNTFSVKNFTGYSTHHGPVMAKQNGQYISVKSNNRSMKSLIQSWQRTKAKGLDDYKKNMELLANTSNNTVFADNKGNIAYWHGNFVPRRNETLNWSMPVDGTTPYTEWKGLHTLDEIVHVYNPPTGFIQNCNSTPFSVSGGSSPLKQDYFPYLAPDGENFRGINAARLLGSQNNFTIDKMIATGYNKQLAAFEILMPALISAFDKNIYPGDSLFVKLYEPIRVLKKWTYMMEENSIATTLAIEWAERLPARLRNVYINEGEKSQVEVTKEFAANATSDELLHPLVKAIDELNHKHGDWQIAWGSINRYQRISGDINQQFNDNKKSFPVAFTAASWGALPAYGSGYFNGSNKRYGVSGNSFVCAVEFGKKVKAKSLLAGGNSGNPASPHFTDQLEMYIQGKFKDVLFYKEEVMQHVVRQYHPGD